MELENRIKYPRTFHHPLSEDVQSDDKKHSWGQIENLYGEEYYASIKMDGECTTVYETGATHARSIESTADKTNAWVRGFAAEKGYLITPDHRICGECMFAKHSLHYTDLPSYFLGFSAWKNEPNVALPLDETIEMFKNIDVKMVEILWRGTLTKEIVENLWKGIDKTTTEGLVFRPVSELTTDDFRKKVFKLVRKGHVTTDKHWKKQELIKNELAKK